MKYSFKIFSIFGIPVELHISFLVLMLLIYIIALFNLIPSVNILTAVLITLIFATVVIHELSHSYIAKRYGIKIQRIVLLPIGGISEMEEIPKEPAKELRIALAGPVSNLIIAVITFAILIIFGTFLSAILSGALYYFTVVNLLLGLFNLLPAFPMDGGRILRAFLAERMDFIKATKLAATIGKQFAIIMAVIGVFFNFLLILVAIFVYLGAEGEYRSVVVSTLLGDEKVKDIMTSDVHTLNPDNSVQETLKIMFREKHMGYPITEDGKLIGIITFHDVSKIPENNRDMLIKEIMSTEMIISDPNENLVETIGKLNRNNIGRLPVIENGELVGIISKTDITKILDKKEPKLD
ncbi:CBS domain-containing protein [Methanobacterium spitsbergense]|uniref:Zinc metalloprotease n=1 Tax=Methanobacterium spitsbergense TaxID=2874285 RepID=A0A8T5UV86_9EURY|nr:CBS domain-containing protein [Methanobacterium spitsbergense]MBZ2165836.1 CBS domain-containing protein [Methanobacterium spitsbergense]